LQAFLDRFDEPILLVESEPLVSTANRSACALLGKDLSQIRGHKGGEVIECVHSYSEKGCGEDIHCESCMIRNTVLETFASGRSFDRVPAYPDIQKIGGAKTYSIRISTEKVGSFVLLRIEYMEE
jgi:hypothetical protein